MLKSPYGSLCNNDESVSELRTKGGSGCDILSERRGRGSRFFRPTLWEKSRGKQRELGNTQQTFPSDLTQDDVQGANHQQVALKLLADLLLDAVVHVRGVVRVELVDENLLGQLDGEAVPVDGDLLHQLATLDPH